MRLHAFTPASPPARRPGSRNQRQRGQIIVIFAGSMLALVALCAVVVDVAWYWTGNLRMQRAADAAALAGVVWLPGNLNSAYATARAEATKNGFTDGAGGVVVTPVQDGTNPRRLKVTITGPVGTFFARAVGINSFPAKRDAKADYVLPVPMGSPDNYYGVGYYVQPQTTTTTNTVTGLTENSGVQAAAAVPSNVWTASSGTLTTAVASTDSANAYTQITAQSQQWMSFDLLNNLAGNEAITSVDGIRVILSNVRLSALCSPTTNTIAVALSGDGGSTWTTGTNVTLNLTDSNQTFTFGATNNMTAWPGQTWNQNALSDGLFRLRLMSAKGCATASTRLRVDAISIQAFYTFSRTTTTTTTTLVDDATVPPPPGQSAITRPQKFWGAMQSQGAPSIQGDAFMTKYDTRKSPGNAVSGTDPDAYYDYKNFYNYAVEIPAGGGGSVWIFDPGFCDGSPSAGTGEYWTVGGTNGNSTRQPVSAYFDLLDTQETQLDLSDDTIVGSTNTSYQRMSGQDHVIYNEQGTTPTAGIADCSSAPGHFGWVLLRSGLSAGTYRLHTYSTQTGQFNANITTNLTDQDDSTGLNAFAFYASSASGSPRVYGLGAMEAYVRLPAGEVSEFYLAQIEKVHAGKTMVINLWDPGDTGNLSANLAILKPTGSGFTPAAFDYQGTPGNTGATAGCGSRSGGGVFSVTTNTGGSSLYNGCWLTIEVQLPTDYSAPTDPVSGEDGWWKIRYTMGNQSGSGATDLTTWKVDIRGNPVHLVLP